MSYELARKKLYSVYRDADIEEDERLGTSDGEDYTIDDFLSIFDEKSRTENLFKYLNKHLDLMDNEGNYATFSYFVNKYACDKSWAKSGNFCKPKGFDDCVNNLSGQINNSDGSVTYDSNTYKEKVTLFPDKTWKSASGKTGVFACANGKVVLEEKKVTTPDDKDRGADDGGSSGGGDERRRRSGGGSSCKDISWVKDDVLTGGKIVKKCMIGTLVGIIQERLKHHGFPNFSRNGNVDSVYGSRTEGEVIKFQQKFDLNDDGKVGQKTLEALLKDKTELKPVSTTTTPGDDFEDDLTDVSTGTSGN